MTSLTVRKGALMARDMGVGLSITFGGFIVGIALIFAVVGAITAMLGGLEGPEWASVWENAGWATRYFPMSIGFMITGIYLPVALANGVTRRSFAVGASIVVSVVALVIAAALVVGYVVEFAIYQDAGAVQMLSMPHLYTSATDAPVVLAEATIVVAAHMSAGWLIGTVYYRLRWLWGTVLLPLAAAPAFAVDGLLSVGWVGDVLSVGFEVERLPLPVAVPAAVGVVVLTLVLTYALVYSTGLRPRSA